MKLLLDTHVWLWSLLDPTRLNRRVRTAVKRAQNELWLSPISVWELIVLSERGRVKLDTAPRAWVAEALAKTPAHQATLNFEVAVRSREILPAHSDPADRFLVVTALIYDLTLVTADQMLIKAKACPILTASQPDPLTNGRRRNYRNRKTVLRPMSAECGGGLRVRKRWQRFESAAERCGHCRALANAITPVRKACSILAGKL